MLTPNIATRMAAGTERLAAAGDTVNYLNI